MYVPDIYLFSLTFQLHIFSSRVMTEAQTAHGITFKSLLAFQSLIFHWSKDVVKKLISWICVSQASVREK